MLREQFRFFIFPLTFALSKAPESTPTGIPFGYEMYEQKIYFYRAFVLHVRPLGEQGNISPALHPAG